jgi:serine/threonine protein kinase
MHVDGIAIADYCRQHPAPATQRLGLFRTVCAAVEHAHRCHVLHRDIKPGNILVTADGTPKLLDFGIAKLLDPEKIGGTPVSTMASQPLMAPEYASPEQHRCNLHKGPNLSGVDPSTGRVEHLFYSRRDLWHEHFTFRGAHIEGLTQCGRATVEVLALNDARRLELRQELLALGELI